jgi:Transposase
VRAGPYKHKTWSTTVCDVANHALIDVLPTRDFTAVARWLRAQPHHVRENLDDGCLDMSKTYNAVFKVVTPKATRVIDRFHVMRHAILPLTRSAVGSNNNASGTAAERVIPSIEPASCWCSKRPHAIPSSKSASRASWHWAIPTARWPSPTR